MTKTQTNESRRFVKTKALITALMMPGLGQAYNREYIKGAVIFFGFALTIPLFTWLATKVGAPYLFALVLLGSLVSLTVFIFGIGDAVRHAGKAVTPPPPMFIWLLMLLPLLGYGGVLFPLSHYVRSNVLESFYSPTESMQPGIMKGDYFFVEKDVNTPGNDRTVKRGDIAVFIDPVSRSRYYVKRVVGLSGDTIELKNSALFVNGKKITGARITRTNNSLLTTEKAQSGKEYKVSWDMTQSDTFKATVPKGHMFVLGDSRNNSLDSRMFGAVPLQNIIGIAKQVWFTRNSDNFHRIGTLLDPNQ